MENFNLKKRRKELFLTLEQVGDYIGVGKSTVRKWETGMIENMKTDKILLLSEILKVHPLEILGIDENINSHYFKLNHDQTHIYVPKEFYGIKNFLTTFTMNESLFNIPLHSILVLEKKSKYSNQKIVVAKTEIDGEYKVRKYTKVNENMIVLSNDEKDEIIDLFMGDYIEILGEIIYYVIPKNLFK